MKEHGITNGIMMGLLSIVISLLLYFFSIDLLFHWWLQLILGIAIAVFFMRRAGIMTRQDQNGILTFKQALRPTFLVYVISTLMSTIFMFVLYKFIDPDLIELTKEKAIESTINMMEMFNAPEDEIDKAVESIEEKDFTPKIGSSLLNYGLGLIFGFLLSLIVSAFIKKNPPEPSLR